MRWPKNWFIWLCFLGIFGAVAGGLGPDFLSALRSYTWPRVPCSILQSYVAQEPFSRKVSHFVLKVEYSYTYAGQAHRSTGFTTGSAQGSTDVRKAERAAIRFAPGSKAWCYVNPRRPQEAVLKRGELWGGLFLLAPFLIIGLMMHESIFAWFDHRRQRERAQHGSPLSDANDAARIEGRAVFFGVLGFIMGLLFFGFCLVTPVREWSRARGWVEREAIITSSELSSHTGMHGPEYSLKVIYEYDFGGRRYRSSRRNFGAGLGEPVADLSAWVAAHPAGTRVGCLVNPQDPTDAVLETSFNISWPPFVVGVSMFALGISMFTQIWQARRLRRLSGAALEEHCTGKSKSDALRLRVRPSPWLLAAACFVAVPPLAAGGAWSLQKGFRALAHGQGDIINLLYGAGAVIGAVWCAQKGWKFLRSARRPRPILRLTPATPRVGAPFHLEWKFPGGGDAVTWLRVWLEGSERAKVRGLVDAHYGPVSAEETRQEIFGAFILADRDDGLYDSGQITASVPANAMHTFRGAKCGVDWHFKLEFGRDESEKLDYKFPIVILPPDS
jgi:hypothetical protein